MQTDENLFSVALRDYRIRKELSQQQLADKLDISRPVISFLENGQQKPSIKVLQRLKERLGLDLFDTVSAITEQEKAYYGPPKDSDHALNAMADLINSSREARMDLLTCIDLFDSIHKELNQLPAELKKVLFMIEALVVQANRKL